MFSCYTTKDLSDGGPTVSLWPLWHDWAMHDVVLGEDLLELRRDELLSIVGDDALWEAKQCKGLHELVDDVRWCLGVLQDVNDWIL